MKKILITLSIAGITVLSQAQGLISTLNTTATAVSTNGVTTGLIAGGAGQYYFALFTASMTTFAVANTQPSLSTVAGGGGWAFTGNYMTNIASAGRLSGGNNIPTIQNWAAGTTNSYVIIGWSANLGSTWAQIQTQITGGFTASGYAGVSSVGFGMAGGGPDSLPAFSLFGSGAGASGTPITGPMTLNAVAPVPEPGTMALAALGGASLLLFRRKK